MYGWRLPTYLFTFSHLLCVLFFFLLVALFCLFGVCRASTNITRPVYFELNFCTRHQNGQYQGKEKKRDNNEQHKKMLRTSQKQACNFRNGK